MKALRFTTLLIFGCLTSVSALAQHVSVHFDYDPAGNRTGRYLKIEKSSQADTLPFAKPVSPQLEQLHARVYPNPTYGIINVEIEKHGNNPVSYTVLDQHGKLIETGRIENGFSTISLISLQASVYYLRLNNGKEQVIFKIIKH
ncbi:MAG: T9SS type A sorting domain-containing protein [Bacteroidales bacterium]|nr:T9SS type A sorting domain-containing protein [Bacteroidales bacterium]MDZ4205176.1 T9SS type A sorting domain-containing protein [Bacteroidales bacterium]